MVSLILTRAGYGGHDRYCPVGEARRSGRPRWRQVVQPQIRWCFARIWGLHGGSSTIFVRMAASGRAAAAVALEEDGGATTG
jgi:hypothetical protein